MSTPNLFLIAAPRAGSTQLAYWMDSHPDISQAAIVPMPDEALGERACCFAVTTNTDISLELLCDYLLGHGIAKTKLPERLVLVDEMPLTPTRKIIKGRLQIPPEIPPN